MNKLSKYKLIITVFNDKATIFFRTNHLYSNKQIIINISYKKTSIKVIIKDNNSIIFIHFFLKQSMMFSYLFLSLIQFTYIVVNMIYYTNLSILNKKYLIIVPFFKNHCIIYINIIFCAYLTIAYLQN